MKTRYALYYTPGPDRALTGLAAAWLGRDAFAGKDVAHPALGLPFPEMVAEPRVYGFHATIVAPFRLAPEYGPDDLQSVFDGFVRSHASVDLGHLRVTPLARVLALMPDPQPEALGQLQGEAVEAFGHLRAPLNDAERARRRPEFLSDKQRDYMERYGYPFVFDEFRFHMTLTGRLEADMQERVKEMAGAYFAPALSTPVLLDQLSLFIQPEPGAPMTVLQTARLEGLRDGG